MYLLKEIVKKLGNQDVVVKVEYDFDDTSDLTNLITLEVSAELLGLESFEVMHGCQINAYNFQQNVMQLVEGNRMIENVLDGLKEKVQAIQEVKL